jgi:hypothetical protein
VKPHPRIRKTVKWGGAVVSVLLVVVWVGSGWWSAAWYGANGYAVYVEEGVAVIRHVDPSSWQGWTETNSVKPTPSERVPRFSFQRERSLQFQWTSGWHSRGLNWTVLFGLWIPPSLLGVATAAAWRLDTLARRRARVGLCPTCNYDRTGLPPGAVCPECGHGGWEGIHHRDTEAQSGKNR